MTREEIFTNLLNHMVKGLMIHDQMANYYDFLGLEEYKDCHEKHYLKENKSYRKLYHYYITRYNRLIPEFRFENPNIIPSSWYSHARQDVDMKTRQQAIEDGLNKWIKWEGSTLTLYQQMYIELMNLGDVAGATEVLKLIKDVEEELQQAEQYQLYKKAMNYDMPTIVQEQQR